MKLIPQSEIDGAAYNNTESLNFGHNSMETKTMANRLDMSFKAGVEFAESKFEELATEFAKYAAKYGLYHIIHSDGKDLFQQFIKDRNEKN